LLLIAFFALSFASHAHGLGSAYVEVSEPVEGQVIVQVKLGVVDPSFAVKLGPGCTLTELSKSDSRWAARGQCNGPLIGRDITLAGMGPRTPEAVVDVRLANGIRSTHLIHASTPTWRVPGSDTRAETARQYVALGLEHILQGTDHLLFLLLLVLLLQRPGAVLLAESAFTVSHSVSFTATVLGWVHVAPAAAEACIALSLLLLAVEVGTNPRPRPLAGAALALVFGLVHGLGFAGGLRAIGLPERDLPIALLMFAVGVELGQVAFLAVVLMGFRLLSKTLLGKPVSSAVAYGAGPVAAYWLIQRLVVALG
jgi:hydrogenase/urease accessory protein HupE